MAIKPKVRTIENKERENAHNLGQGFLSLKTKIQLGMESGVLRPKKLKRGLIFDVSGFKSRSPLLTP